MKNYSTISIAMLVSLVALVAGALGCGNDGGSDDQDCPVFQPNCGGQTPSPSPSPSPSPTPPGQGSPQLDDARQTLRATCYTMEDCGMDVAACLTDVDQWVAAVTPYPNCYDELSAVASCVGQWECYADGSTYVVDCDSAEADLNACLP